MVAVVPMAAVVGVVVVVAMLAVVVCSTLQVGSWQFLQSAVLAPQELPDDFRKYQLNWL